MTRAARVERQAGLFGPSLPLWKRWDLACDAFDDDLESGYIRVLQEMIAAGWSSEQVGADMREMLMGWNGVLTDTLKLILTPSIRSVTCRHPGRDVGLLAAPMCGGTMMVEQVR